MDEKLVQKGCFENENYIFHQRTNALKLFAYCKHFTLLENETENLSQLHVIIDDPRPKLRICGPVMRRSNSFVFSNTGLLQSAWFAVG